MASCLTWAPASPELSLQLALQRVHGPTSTKYIPQHKEINVAVNEF